MVGHFSSFSLSHFDLTRLSRLTLFDPSFFVRFWKTIYFLFIFQKIIDHTKQVYVGAHDFTINNKMFQIYGMYELNSNYLK